MLLVYGDNAASKENTPITTMHSDLNMLLTTRMFKAETTYKEPNYVNLDLPRQKEITE